MIAAATRLSAISGVDVVERVGRLVEVIEGGGVADEVGARVDRGAQVSMLDAVDGAACLVGDVLVAAGAESDHDDAWPGVGRRVVQGGHPLVCAVGHAQPRLTTVPVSVSNVP